MKEIIVIIHYDFDFTFRVFGVFIIIFHPQTRLV